jgi:hypothetical protein
MLPWTLGSWGISKSPFDIETAAEDARAGIEDDELDPDWAPAIASASGYCDSAGVPSMAADAASSARDGGMVPCYSRSRDLARRTAGRS